MRFTALLLMLAWPLAASPKPIAFADGWTVMGEYGGDTFREAQVFYAPKYWWSGGLSYTRLLSTDKAIERVGASLEALGRKKASK